MACSITGLTTAEKNYVKESWKFISPAKKDNGVKLFMALFNAHPDTLGYFNNLGGNLETMKGTADMRAHGAAVMYAMESLVENLDDPECMIGLIRKLARNHKGRNIGKPQFELLRGLFGEYLDTNLAGKSSTNIKAAWDKFLTFTNNQIDKEQK